MKTVFAIRALNLESAKGNFLQVLNNIKIFNDYNFFLTSAEPLVAGVTK
jgi:hypothetical protein